MKGKFTRHRSTSYVQGRQLIIGSEVVYAFNSENLDKVHGDDRATAIDHIVQELSRLPIGKSKSAIRVNLGGGVEEEDEVSVSM